MEGREAFWLIQNTIAGEFVSDAFFIIQPRLENLKFCLGRLARKSIRDAETKKDGISTKHLRRILRTHS